MAYVERIVNNVAWDSKGKKIEGRLLSISTQRYRDGSTSLVYKVETNPNAFVLFQGATQLNQKLTLADRGCNIFVEYLGEDESRQMPSDKNRPKLFKVMVDAASKQQVAASADPGITDDDIPF